MKCGLLGRTLGHSYSPAIHALLGEYEYCLFEKEPQQLEDFLQNGDYEGLNVTMPYKKAVIPFLDEITPIAKELGAVNTIVRRNGRLIGSNTDYWGFRSMVEKSGLSPAGKKCLVLGSGGASRVVQSVLQNLDAQTVVISRSGKDNYDTITRHADAAIIVNTTPVGMYPDTGISPVNLDVFPQLEGVLDVIYNPSRTQLLMDAEKKGIVAMNGLWMLISQAMYASISFAGKCTSDKSIEEIHRIFKAQMENMILVGMPGCGKTTIGQLIAEKTGKIFVDTDAQIEKLAGKTIPAIFSEDGEAAFRIMETKVLTDLGKQSGLILSTGGGCVTQKHNYPLLHQNGTIFYLQRDLSKLPTDGRPLSKTGSLEQIYAERKPLYQAFADHIIDNNETVEKTVNAILEKLP